MCSSDLGAVAGDFGAAARGVSHAQSLYFVFVLLSLLLVLLIYLFKILKPKKISVVFIPVFTFYFVIRLGRMSSSTTFVESPEAEVLTFKQRGGESLKYACYRIRDSHHRSTKEPLATVLLRNFYVGITNWYRYILDTITGGNFLGVSALEAMNAIKV